MEVTTHARLLTISLASNQGSLLNRSHKSGYNINYVSIKYGKNHVLRMIKTMSKKVQINFDDGALDVIERLKEATGTTTTGDVIRDALSLYEWARREYEQGRKIGTIENGRGVREVILPFELRGNLKSSGNKQEK
jgi:hypothetical protein